MTTSIDAREREQSLGSALPGVALFGLAVGIPVALFSTVAQGVVETTMGSTTNAGENVLSGVVYGAIVAVTAVIFLLMYTCAVHVAASRALGGNGSVARLLHRTTRSYTLMVGAVAVINLLMLTLVSSQPLALAIALGSLLIPLGTFIRAGAQAGDAYRVSTRAGCVSLVLGVVVLAAALATFSLAVTLLARLATGR